MGHGGGGRELGGAGCVLVGYGVSTVGVAGIETVAERFPNGIGTVRLPFPNI